MESLISVDELIKEAFDRMRTPRSPEYQAGVRAALAWKIEGIHIVNIYHIGTAQADAFFAGLDEGYQIYRDLK